jgi:BlaI family penicillinase repressor
MTKETSAPRPTDAELAILAVLWDRGPSTVREVHDTLSSERNTGYTTVLKTLQIMTDKGLVTREDTARAHVYQATPSQEQAQRSLLGDLMNRAFGGSAQKLIMQALATHKTSPEELAEIRRMLDEMEGQAK